MVRPKAVVAGGVPLRGGGGERGGKVVEPGEYRPSSMNGATGAFGGSAPDRRLPFVPQFAAPPHLSLAARGYLIRSKIAVLRRMPLGGNVGEAGGEIVVPGEHCPPGMNRATAAPRGAVVDRHFPLVPLLAAPPHLFHAAHRHLIRPKITVLSRMPLRRDVRELVRERLSGLGWARGGHGLHVSCRSRVDRVVDRAGHRRAAVALLMPTSRSPGLPGTGGSRRRGPGRQRLPGRRARWGIPTTPSGRW